MLDWRVPLSDLTVDDELAAAVTHVVKSGWWSMGPRVSEFESAFAVFSGTHHALAVANGTAALHLALLACGCGPGDEVILPSLNFVAAANMVVRTGATPTFCDIVSADNLNLDPDDVAAATSPRTKAVIVLHYGGYPADVAPLRALAEATDLVLIEDAAHAPGATYRGEPCGALGAMGCFSFFSNKNLPIGEGGMIVTHDEQLAERLRLLRSHGMTSLTWDRARGHAASYDVILDGFNYRFDEMRAALGLVQLSRLPAMNAARARLAGRYRQALGAIPDLVIPFPEQPIGTTSAHHLQVVVLPAGVSRDRVRSTLQSEGIQTSVHYPPIHLFSRYRALQTRALPVTESICERLLTLPLYPALTDEQVDLVTAAVAHAIADAS